MKNTSTTFSHAFTVAGFSHIERVPTGSQEQNRSNSLKWLQTAAILLFSGFELLSALLLNAVICCLLTRFTATITATNLNQFES